MTIAFNKLPLGSKVRITNLDNGKSVEAIVTDRGGFEKLGRIADLTPAVRDALNTKTDITQVEIEVIN
jgi:rare lipoprotein A